MNAAAPTGPNPREAFFDALADSWDEIVEMGRMLREIPAGLQQIGVGPSEQVLDLGCGTGVLLGALLEVLGPRGRVEAVDLSRKMIARARAKFPDPRVGFHLADAARLPLQDGQVNRAICFSAWPHFPDPDRVIMELCRVLQLGGRVHVWHVDSRETINAIHCDAGEAVQGDMLEPAEQLAARFGRLGFRVTEALEAADAYWVSATKLGVKAEGGGP